jgi:hypothetical protein
MFFTYVEHPYKPATMQKSWQTYCMEEKQCTVGLEHYYVLI